MACFTAKGPGLLATPSGARLGKTHGKTHVPWGALACSFTLQGKTPAQPHMPLQRSKFNTVNIGYKNTPWDQREGVLIGESSYSQSIGYKNTLNTSVLIADVIGYKNT